DEAGDDIGGHGEVLRIVGAGVLSGPAAAVAWLTRRELAGRRPRVQEVVRVLTARPAGWQADAAVRLAGKIRAADDRNAPLALALLRACGAPPPEHDPLVTAWLRTRPDADDPLIGPLLPRIFEAEGAGRVLREERLEPVPTRWLSLLQRLQAAGRVSRGELLDGCLRRFLRGGDTIGLRFFVRLHRMLDPTPQEAAARVRDYLRLLPTAPGAVAELALAQVRYGGPHEEAEVIEAIGALTFRPEAKLALEGLRRLERELPHAAALAPALAAAFGHVSYEVQGRAARIALKHAAAFAPAGEAVAEAVPLLPAALGARVAAVYGGEVQVRVRLVPNAGDDDGPGNGERAEEEGEPERAFGDLPEHVREEISEQLLEIGVSKERVAAMRDGLRVPLPAGPASRAASASGSATPGPAGRGRCHVVLDPVADAFPG
ncbi:hypothetical protein, partial [Nonomuraea terrae]|uniref:hypothetical protein n=1 Tax=Nonomuraea terrae TaxID=2530383 RepID=UPI001CB6C6A9